MNMRLRPFGRTGLMISPFTLGSMEFGSKVDPTEASRLLDRAIEAGVIALDTANVHAGGQSEEIVGRLIAEGASASSLPRNSPCLPTFRTRTLEARRVAQ